MGKWHCSLEDLGLMIENLSETSSGRDVPMVWSRWDASRKPTPRWLGFIIPLGSYPILNFG